MAVLTDPAGAAQLIRPAPAAPVSVSRCWSPTTRGRCSAASPRRSTATRAARLAVVGVTGTSGKTTTCYLLEAALAADGSKTGLIGTVQTRIDGEVAPSALTTPEAPDLQALFAVMVERGVGVVAMEVSSHALSLGRVSGTSFAVGAFTNLSQDHLDFHHDMEEYFARQERCCSTAARTRHVIDIDDAVRRPAGRRRIPDALTVSAPATRPPTGRSIASRSSTTGIQHVTLARPAGSGRSPLDLALPGAFNVANAAARDGLRRRARPGRAAGRRRARRGGRARPDGAGGRRSGLPGGRRLRPQAGRPGRRAGRHPGRPAPAG